MTMAQVIEVNRLAAIDQLYDRWQGHYRLIADDTTTRRAVRDLSKIEAQQYRLRKGEALEIVWRGSLSWPMG